MNKFRQNQFLFKLLALQQDGSAAISAPSNWVHEEPLLDVETKIDKEFKRMQNSILSRNGKNCKGKWHFLIGSPGNGKSAAIGKLCRTLINEENCTIVDGENGEDITELDKNVIPYALYVRENKKNFASVQIVQDATVVRNPYATDVNPAKDLIETLKEAWNNGRSLVVCTNRGVLEQAEGDYHMDHDVRNEPWFKILLYVHSNSSDENNNNGHKSFQLSSERNSVFRSVEVSHSNLENLSLLLHVETFELLVKNAISDCHWNECRTCASKSLCPFYANYKWLADGRLRENFLELLLRAELFSGQVIVFREALALISLILAGCPSDYDKLHPCDWVHKNIKNHNYFALAVRRIYMSLFASSSRFGLEASSQICTEQTKNLQQALKIINKNSDAKIFSALAHVVGHKSDSSTIEPPTINVGIKRLLGRKGVMARIDPCLESLPEKFYRNWDENLIIELTTKNMFHITDIEIQIEEIWKALERNLESSFNPWGAEAYWAIRRWRSNYFLHLGALVDGKSAWSEELDDLKKMIKLLQSESISFSQKNQINEIETNLKKLVGVISGPESAVPLSDFVTISGEWVITKLKPKIDAGGAIRGSSLPIEFISGDTKNKEKIFLSALMYLWLKRVGKGYLDDRSFPHELMIGLKHARIRACIKGQYSRENDDVSLIIKTPENGKFQVSRIDGDAGLK